MAQFKLTKKAVEDLSKIWDYTFEVWSGRQADKYYESIVSNCQEIADNPDLGKRYDGIAVKLFGFKTNRHIIFYRTVDKDYVEITRVLHERIDLKKRIAE